MALRERGLYLSMVLFVYGAHAEAQSANEHASHHPAPAAGGTATPAPVGPACCMEGEMMLPPAQELYPSLMRLRDLPVEQRADVERRAHERMVGSASAMSEGITKLTSAVQRLDYAAMQSATEETRQALGRFESGLAAHRALAEGEAPRAAALRWFKREMSLTRPPVPGDEQPVGDLSTFHWVSMLLLAAFLAAATSMFVVRKRRTEALLRELAVAPESAGGYPDVREAPRAGDAPVRAAPSTTGGWSGILRVARIFDETPDVKTFRLMPVAGSDLPFEFEPGQFLTIGVPANGKVVRRSYSIASSPCCQGWCEITVKRTPGGVVSGYLHERVRVGDTLEASGPYGRFTFRGREAASVVMIAGGVGITPMMSSIRYLTDQSWPGDIHLVYASSRLDSVIFREELDHLARRHPNLKVTLVLDREDAGKWSGERGYVTGELLTRVVPDLNGRRVHLCGPPPMMQAVKQALALLHVPESNVFTELFLAPEPKPAAGTPEKLVTGAVCSFSRSQKSADLGVNETVLEAAERVGVPIDYSCRQGFCGICKVPLTSGHVTMEIEDGLTSRDRGAGLVLACQARAAAAITIDA